MTFDFTTAASIPHQLPRNNPSELPCPPFPPPWTVPGFWLNFSDAAHSIDANHSVNYIYDAGRNLVCPTRNQGGTVLWEPFGNGLGAWQLVQTGTGQSLTSSVSSVDPAIVGTALDLNTGASLGSIAGALRYLGTVPNTFSYFALPNTLVVANDPREALHIWVQNNAAVTLQTRLYGGVIEVYADGAWRTLTTVGGPYFFEGWVECGDNGNGTHTVKFYGGTVLQGSYTGVLPTGQLTNNAVYVAQTSGGTNNYRRSLLKQINVGPTQLADNMVHCTPPAIAAASPTNGHLMILFEDVSRDVCPGTNLKAFVSKNGTNGWVEVPLCDYGIAGKGRLDVTADVRRFAGSVCFPAGSGTTMRANITTSNGTFPVLHGLTMFWDCAP